MVYKVECSWCKRHMGTKEGESSDFALKMKQKGYPVVSHSICPVCLKELKKKYNLKGAKNVR